MSRARRATKARAPRATKAEMEERLSAARRRSTGSASRSLGAGKNKKPTLRPVRPRRPESGISIFWPE
jgi:hypothetical protein